MVRILRFGCALWLGWLGCLLASCTNPDARARIIEASGEQVCEHPDSVRLLLSTIDRRHLHDRRLEADYALFYTQALDGCGIDVASDSLIRIAADYYAHGRNRHRHAWALFHLGKTQYNAASYAPALGSLLEAEREALPTGDRYLGGLINDGIARIYEACRDDAQAYEYDLRAWRHYREANRTDRLNVALGNRARLAVKLDRPDDAAYYCRRADSMALARRDTAMHRRIVGSAVYLSFRQRDFEKTRLLLELYGRLNGGELQTAMHLVLGDMALAACLPDSARRTYARALSGAPDLGTRLGTHQALYRLERMQNRPAAALEHLTEYVRLRDSSDREEERRALLRVRNRFEQNELALQNHRLGAYNRYGMIGFGLLLLLACTLTLRYRSRFREHGERIEAYRGALSNADKAQQELLQQLDACKEREERLKSMLTNRFDTVRQFSSLVYKYEKHPGQLYKQLREVLHIDAIDRAEFKDLVDVINTNNGGAIDMIRRAYPHLNETDIVFCCLIFAGFTMEEMCVIYNLSSLGSLYTKRSRLKHKFGIDDSVDLNQFLHDLIGK